MAVVVAVQMKGRVADVAYNLDHVDELLQEAVRHRPHIIALPEFFTTPIVQDDRLWGCALPPENPALDLLRDVATTHDVLIGGSYLERRGDDVYNCYALVHPDGRVTRHDKDQPTMIENAYMTGGNDDGWHETVHGNVGTAVCWETIRTQTVRRLQGRVDFLMTGSHWWAPPRNWRFMRRFFRTMDAMNRTHLHHAPATLSKLLGVANIHASHVGPLHGRVPVVPNAAWNPRFESYLLGETQIVDHHGKVQQRLRDSDGPGVISAPIQLTRQPASLPLPDRFWIPDLEPRFRFFWWQQNLCAKAMYARAKANDRLRNYALADDLSSDD